MKLVFCEAHCVVREEIAGIKVQLLGYMYSTHVVNCAITRYMYLQYVYVQQFVMRKLSLIDIPKICLEKDTRTVSKTPEYL